MTDDDDDHAADSNALDADDRARAVHEAGHAVVADALGAKVEFVEIFSNGGGRTECDSFADNIKNLAVCVAGYKAELSFAAHDLRLSKTLAAHAVRSTGDYRQMQELLLRLPEIKRLAALGESFSLADEMLKTKKDVVSRIADALFARRFSAVARIERNELAVLFAGDGTA